MKFISHSSVDTIDIGCRLGLRLTGGEIIELNGPMGGGKTVFTKGVAKGLNITADIVSPTFSILNIYNGKLSLCHYDCYRLYDSTEAAESGLDEYFNLKDHICVIEWPQNIESLLSSYKTIKVNIDYKDENTREIEIIGLPGRDL